MTKMNHDLVPSLQMTLIGIHAKIIIRMNLLRLKPGYLEHWLNDWTHSFHHHRSLTHSVPSNQKGPKLENWRAEGTQNELEARSPKDYWMHEHYDINNNQRVRSESEVNGLHCTYTYYLQYSTDLQFKTHCFTTEAKAIKSSCLIPILIFIFTRFNYHEWTKRRCCHR